MLAATNQAAAKHTTQVMRMLKHTRAEALRSRSSHIGLCTVVTHFRPVDPSPPSLTWRIRLATIQRLRWRRGLSSSSAAPDESRDTLELWSVHHEAPRRWLLHVLVHKVQVEFLADL